MNKYNWDTSIAMAIMQAESSCKKDNVGDTWEIGGLYAPSCGLFQVRTLEGRPSCKELHNPEVNVLWAYKIYVARGNWTAWTVYNNGKYKQFLR